MKTVKIKEKRFSLYISEAEISKEVKRVASNINNDLEKKKPLFLVVLNGAFIFAADLLREISIPCETNFIRVASYEGTTSTGEVKEILGLNEDIEGRTIVIVEDIIDTGTTMCKLLQMLEKKKAADIRIASLFVKPESLQTDLKIDYHCFDISNEFIVGYGLDYNQEGRNLPAVYKIMD